MSRARLSRLAVIAGLALLPVNSLSAANGIELGEDGWHTWRAPANEYAGDRCCYEWNRGRPTKKGCDLDNRRGGYSTFDDERYADTGQIQVYVLVESGKVRRIRGLSPACPVTADSEIADLGEVGTSESVAWLQRFADRHDDAGEDAIATISAHEGDAAVDALARIIENRRLARDQRRQALFWLAPAGTDEALGYIDRLLASR